MKVLTESDERYIQRIAEVAGVPGTTNLRIIAEVVEINLRQYERMLERLTNTIRAQGLTGSPGETVDRIVIRALHNAKAPR